jgi:hypothetical protein
MSSESTSLLLSAHEERLQRLETDRAKLLAVEAGQIRSEERLAKVEEKVDNLTEVQGELREILIEVSTTMKFFGEKIEGVSNRLSDRHQSLEEALTSVITENKSQGDDIKGMKKAEAKADRVFDWKMKFLFGTGAATGGAILSMLIEYFKKKFGG